MEWVASTLMPPPNVVYPALLKLMRTPRLPAVDRTDAPTDLNGLVRFGERRNLVSARVPSRSARAIITNMTHFFQCIYLFPFSTCFEQPSAHHQENRIVSVPHLAYVVCSKSVRIGIVVVVHWVGCVCNQS